MSDSPGAALRSAQSRIARALLGMEQEVDARLGELRLRPHQVSAVGRLLQIIATYRGALLADAVGLGKTYVALAVARRYRKAAVVCPAALRGMWDRAMTSARTALPIHSTESLSRGTLPDDEIDLLIVDEAHHFRTPGTRRYEAVATVATRARVLLLSATPLHNSRRDLTALLALFAGSGIARWTDAALARLIVRRDDTTAGQWLPAISGPQTLSPGEDDDCLDAILALPPAIPAADEGVAHALATISLLHLWASSRAALVASVRKRLARAMALRDAVESGHLPTAGELSAWSYADETLQLAFPLFPATDEIDSAALNSQLAAFIDGARALLDKCRATPDPDTARAALLRALRERHAGERIVAFSQYAHTITGLGRLMRADRGIAVVTAGGARIASGAIPREAVLRQFAGDATAVSPVEHLGLLLTTDLLSEGIDLRGASVVVHLDLPWNPARMEQRVGRSRRIGSPFARIHVYTFVPPTAAERMIELRARLTGKVRVASEIVGGAFDPFGGSNVASSPIDAGEAVRQATAAWLLNGDAGDPNSPVVAAAESPVCAWIAVVVTNGARRLIGDFGSGITDSPEDLGLLIPHIRDAVAVPEERRGAVLKAIHEWVAARDASACAEIRSPARRAVLERLALTVSRAPRHRRSALVAAAQSARSALSNAASVGTERILATLARSKADDAAWLQSLEAFAALHAENGSPQARSGITDVILLEPPRGEAATPG